MSAPAGSKRGRSAEACDAARLEPLSHGQAALWLLAAVAPTSCAYTVVYAARVRSALDAVALEQAVRALVARHPILGDTYREVEGEPVRVRDLLRAEIGLQQVDVCSLDEDGLRAAVVAEAQRPFALQAEPPFRVSLFTRAPDDHVLMLAVHHIAVDYWSAAITVEELFTLYAAETGAEAPAPADVPVDYAEFVRWQQAFVDDAAGERARAYWRAELDGRLPVLELQDERPRPRFQTFAGASIVRPLPKNVLDLVRAAAQAEGVTVFTLLLTVYEALLHRFTAQDDLLVGCPTAGRTRREFQRMVGYLANPVAIRSQLTGEESFRDLLANTHRRVVGAIAHQDLPFPLVAREKDAERDPSRPPIFQVNFSVQSSHAFGELLELQALGEAAGHSVERSGLRLEAYDVPQQEGQFDLSLDLLETRSSLTAVFKFNRDVLTAETVDRLAGSFVQLLESALATPELPVSRLSLLSQAERRLLLGESNAAPADRPTPLLHDLVRERAQTSPASTAASCGPSTLSYGDLEQRSTALAARLHGHGVERGHIVAVCLERSLDLLVSFVAVLKAGATYLPLDPAYPAERLEYMLRDSGPRALLSSGTLARRFGIDVPFMLVGEQGSRAEEVAEGPVPSDAAYVIYTSGSTGSPKGVVVEHRSLANLATAQRALLSVSSEDRILQFSPLSFDAWIWELAMTLGAGATLVVPPPETVLAGAELAQLIRDESITHVTLPPSALATLDPSDVPSLETVVAAGEACPVTVAAAWAGHCRFYNAYGPTETTVCATAHECRPDDRRPPIGHPLANVRVYVVDRHGGLLPPLFPGELLVGGAGLARGYLDRPELTDERFVDDPVHTGERVYRTGDRVRRLADGSLDFLGRLDEQLKIRGFRVEPGEIEAALRAHPAIVDAAVVADGEGPAARLAAFLVATGSGPTDARALRAELASRLPEYMLPSQFLWVDELPRSPSGKVDRPRLREAAGHPPDESALPIQTETEGAVAAAYAAVLGLGHVGADGDFFQLGGQSLTAVQVASRIGRHLGLDVPLSQIYGAPVVADLAARLDELARSGGEARPAEPGPRVIADHDSALEPFPLTDVQQAYWLGQEGAFELGGVSAHGYFELDSSGLDTQRLEESWNALVERHPMLRAVFLPDGQQRILAETPRYQIDVTDLRRRTQADRSRHETAVRGGGGGGEGERGEGGAI
jgi:amino acid adenylation domain-containing protein